MSNQHNLIIISAIREILRGSLGTQEARRPVGVRGAPFEMSVVPACPLLVGTETGDDAAVWSAGDERAPPDKYRTDLPECPRG